MRVRGYDVTYETNRKDLCDMVGLSSDSTKEDICDRLKIPYVKSNLGGVRLWRRVKLYNIYDPSHVVTFRSMAEAGRELNIEINKLYTYINDPTLTVEYEGYVFTVSFVEE